MLKKLLLRNSDNYKIIICELFFIISLQLCNLPHLFCSYVEVLFLPYSTEETILMQGLQVVSEGKYAVGNNPAGCGMDNKRGFSFSSTLWRSQENFHSLTLFLPQKFANFGLKVKYANFTETELVTTDITKIKKENLYSLILHTSFGKEMLTSGLFLGGDIVLGNIKFDESITLGGSKVGFLYMFDFAMSEVYFASSVGMVVCSKEKVVNYSFGLKYLMPYYRTSLFVTYNENIYSFFTVGVEVELKKNLSLVCGYETSFEKSLSNYSFGIKFVKEKVSVSLGTRYNIHLGWITSVEFNSKI
ncbi:MAG: hypothetical protein NZ839_00310 [Endomicrobia bacterium]|nr:hypothetical protein [Endomicrobiia bacterium]